MYLTNCVMSTQSMLLSQVIPSLLLGSQCLEPSVSVSMAENLHSKQIHLVLVEAPLDQKPQAP